MDNQKIAESLLFPLWQCVSSDFKERYKADSWGIFENFVRASACSENLVKFFEKFKKLMPFDWLHKHEKDIKSVIECGQDYEVLSAMRSETSYLVLLVRELNQERKDSFKK